MRIESDFEISERSLDEFTRVLIPEAREKDVKITSQKIGNELEITVKTDNAEGTIRYKDLEKSLEDQKIVMVKTSLLKAYGKKYPWGGLIGVRPTKLVRKMLALGFERAEIENILTGMYLVSSEKAELLMDTVEKELQFLNREYINVYIGIPFCPTKCRYCSFASYEIGSTLGKYYPEFVETLLEEIEITGDYMKQKGFKIESLYIGGGTPSTLTERDLERVLQKIKEKIDLSYVKEFTFEAGREDTLTRRKLELLKEYGVDRISLNPQTFNEETLRKLNRTFNRERFDMFYDIIKELGFILNMDLILGLPGEGVEEILKTLEEVSKYDMENLTIHSLALKKASDLFKESHKHDMVDREIIEKKIAEILERKGLKPYYLYRQKNSLDWGENVGYSKEGFESIFNIEMIEENQSTIGLGGGAISKLIEQEDSFHDRIERVVNPKDPAMYIKEMKERAAMKCRLFDEKK